MNSITLTVSIACDPTKVYEFVSNLENLPKWAKTFCKSIQRTKDGWVLESPQGPVKIWMAEKNILGVLDHTVSPTPDVEILVPMRVVPNGKGSEVFFTLFHQTNMPDEQFARDIRMVEQDLQTLKSVLSS